MLWKYFVCVSVREREKAFVMFRLQTEDTNLIILTEFQENIMDVIISFIW